jgi:tRNA_anti-like
MKKILIGVILVGLVTSAVIYVLYNKPHRDPATEKSIPVSSIELFRSFEEDEVQANKLYLDKVLEISGKITEITANQDLTPIIVLETENMVFGIRCTMNDSETKVRVGESITVRGICTGYLSDVIITNAIIVKNN